MSDHRELRESLAAYVLGALEPAERHAVEEHLHSCAECRDEVSRFSPLPQLLGRLTAEEAASGALAPHLDILPELLAEETVERARLRRHLLGWRVATAAAVAAAVLVWAPWAGPPPAERVPASPVAAEAAAVTGSAAAHEWEWGTTVEIEVQNLPVRDAYVLWAVAQDGRRQQAGVWGATEARAALVRGAAAIQRQDLERVEVTDADGELLLTFSF